MIITSKVIAMARAATSDIKPLLTGRMGLAKPAVYELSDSNGIRDEFLLVPKGATYWRWLPEETRFTVEPSHLIQMVENFAKIPRKPFFDLEHESCYSMNTKAYGWIEGLDLRDDGLWVTKYSLTKEGEELLTSGAYKYFSAAWEWNHVEEESGQDVGCWLVSIALTNDPQYTRLEGLVTNAAQEVAMDFLKKLAALLGLPETAKEADVLSAVEAQVAEHKAVVEAAQQVEQALTDAPADQAAAASAELKARKPAKVVALAAAVLAKTAGALATVRTGLGLSATATAEEIVLTAKAKGSDTELAQRLAAMEEQQALAKAEAAVERAMAAGKVTPAMKPEALAFAKNDLPGFEAWMAKQPAVVPTKPVTARAVDQTGKPIPTEQEKRTAKATGVSPEDVAMQRALRTGEVAAG